MNDIRRTILWVIFGFSMVMLWDRWQIHNGRQATFFPTTPATTAAKPAAEGAGNAAVPPASTAPAAPSANQVGGATAVPGAATAANPAAAPAATPRETIVVTTDLMKLTFDTEGGSLVRTEFLKHRDLEKRDLNFVLLDTGANRVYQAQTGLVGAPDLPNHKTVMRFVGERELKDGAKELVLRFESPVQGGAQLVKTYTLKRGQYDMAVRHEVINSGSASVSPQLYLQLVRDGNKPAGESSFYSTFTGPAVYTEAKKFQKVEFSDIEKNKAEFEKASTNGYVSMVQHYFASAWLLASGVQRELFMRKVDTNLYSVGMVSPLGAVAPGATVARDAVLYAGPQEEKLLEQLAPGLELVKDYGWLTILAKPLYWLLEKLHSFIGNWGWAIVALVLLIKIAFYWLNAKAYESMAKMKAINPRIMEMRERLKNNPQQMQMEMMKIYREEKVNPLGGCFPIAVQIPVFIALYWVLLASVEMRNAPWLGWITDLSAPDPWFILPVVMTLTTLLQTALNPAPPDPMQAKLMWLMPLVFSVMFFFFPSGLVLYWITNNVLSIAQQWIINTRMGVPPQFNLPKFK
ncbi:MAG: membrane protein insertase YidC [Betaproteobacteria bacterium]|nr:membrane protein insertase YidC [Betaproteobacteria bacterium]